jgi:hypothetical protein
MVFAFHVAISFTVVLEVFNAIFIWFVELISRVNSFI